MKKSQKGFVVPLLIGIIALLLIGGGVYIYENEKVETSALVDNTTQQSNQAQQTNKQNSSPVPVKSSITVSSPNGQEVWVNGSQQTIRWTSKGVGAMQPVEINLERKGPTDTQFWNIGTIATNQPGSGSYTWTVSSKDTTGSIVANSQYKILIGRDLAKGTGPVDESDNYFLIATPTTQSSITVLYPNGGDVLNNGGRDNITTIRWDSSGIDNSNVQIVLVNKTNDEATLIASNVPNTGSYNWKMDPTIATGVYKINISSVQHGWKVSDYSDGYFEISTRSVVPGKTFVTLLSPNGGETFVTGNRLVIKWSSLGEKPTSATIRLSNNGRCPYGYSCTPLPNSFSIIAEISGSDLDKGEYEWIVSKSNVNSPKNNYLIGIMLIKDDLSNASYDDSDSSFIIN